MTKNPQWRASTRRHAYMRSYYMKCISFLHERTKNLYITTSGLKAWWLSTPKRQVCHIYLYVFEIWLFSSNNCFASRLDNRKTTPSTSVVNEQLSASLLVFNVHGYNWHELLDTWYVCFIACSTLKCPYISMQLRVLDHLIRALPHRVL